MSRVFDKFNYKGLLIRATKRLLNVAREKQIPIIFTNVAYEDEYDTGAYFIKKVPALKSLRMNSDFVDIDHRLNRDPNKEILITKKFASAFFGTNLCSLLNYRQIDTVILAGASTSGCIRATAVDGLQYGFRVIVPEQCVGDRSQYAHEANLYDIQTKYGDVISVDETIKQIKQLKGDSINV